MELTNEQYLQILQYLDEQMNRDESAAFVGKLKQDQALQEELKLFQEIQYLGESIANKVNTFSERESIPEEANAFIIKQARDNWETQDNLLNHTTPALIIPIQSIRSSNKKNAWKWVLAASLTGIITLTALVFYKNDQADHMVQNKAFKQPSAKRPVQKHMPSQTPADPMKQNTTAPNKSNEIAGTLNEIPPANINNSAISRKKLDALFAENFIPDSLPSTQPEGLNDGFNFYQAGNYEQAISAMTEREQLLPRGVDEDQSVTLFYTSYYKALCYLSINKMEMALKYLNLALNTNPDIQWKTKTQWYLALAHIKKGNINKALLLLKRISSSTERDQYKNKALKMIKELENNK